VIVRGRVLAVGITVAVGAALLAAAADQAVAPESAPEASSKADGAQAPSGRPAASGAHAAPAGKRQRVPAGVLVRAASRRAHEREAANPAVPERKHGREEGEVLSVEIDWHAGASADR
jgi:hypothetical protein